MLVTIIAALVAAGGLSGILLLGKQMLITNLKFIIEDILIRLVKFLIHTIISAVLWLLSKVCKGLKWLFNKVKTKVEETKEPPKSV